MLSSSSRLLRVLSLLQTRSHWAGPELAEALAVAIALQIAAAGTVSGVEESSLRALVKLEQVMPPRLRRRTHALRSAIVPVQRMGPTIDAGVLASLATACRDQLEVGFSYRDLRGQASVRQVQPHGP